MDGMAEALAVDGLAVVSEDEVARLLDLDELAEALTVALIALSRGEASVPPRVAATGRGGLLGAMPGWVGGLGLASKLVSVFPGNGSRGLPSHQAVVVVFDEATGAPVALLGGRRITAIRTAMTSALAARALVARVAGDEGAYGGAGGLRLAVLGAGVQGAAHLEAFTHLLPIADVRVASRDHGKATELAGRYPAGRAVGWRDAVEGADIVCCCTDAREPVVSDAWIRPGVHLSSVGSGAEVPPETVGRAQVYVESRAAVLPPPAGAVELAGRDPETLTELGQVLSGESPGRADRDAVTVFKSTGNAVEDVAAAAVVLRRARATGAGVTVPLGGVGPA
jgi:alanine dehydrogenase